MKKNPPLNAWRISLLLGLIYASFYLIMLKILNPKGNEAGIVDWLVAYGEAAISIMCIYILYLILNKVAVNIPIGYRYMLVLLLSVPLFCIIYLAYWVAIRKIFYGFSTPYGWYITQLLVNTIGCHLPIGIISIVSLYNSHVHRIQIELITARNLSTENQLKGLQQQVEPHFLFNSLNILVSLIKMDTEKSILFTQKLSDVYRFFLTTKQENFILLEEELVFIEEYFYLIKCRFADAYKLEISILNPPDAMDYYIVPGTLQLLIENVIKHNTADVENPINIIIKSDLNGIRVVNRIAKKETSTSGHGLNNLALRYDLFSKHKVDYFAKDGFFHVWLPLIRKIS